MFAYCGNNPISRIDRIGCLWESVLQTFCSAFSSAINEASGVLAFAGGLTQADTIAPGPADIVGAGILVGTILVCVGIAAVDTLAATKEKTETGSVVMADVRVETKRNKTVFYGVDMYGGEWKYVTPPMDFDTALAWVTATAAEGFYGKNASWGLYTEKQTDAIAMAAALGGGAPCWHGNNVGQYNHYHVLGMLLFGKYKHFHVWYGSIFGG